MTNIASQSEVVISITDTTPISNQQNYFHDVDTNEIFEHQTKLNDDIIPTTTTKTSCCKYFGIVLFQTILKWLREFSTINIS